MQKIQIFCDACGKEFEKGTGGSTFAGVIARFDTNLEKQGYKFVEDFCTECSEVVLNFVVALKKDIKEKTPLA